MDLMLDDVDFKLEWGSYLVKVNNFSWGNKQYTYNHNHNLIEIHISLTGNYKMLINSVNSYSIAPNDENIIKLFEQIKS